MTATGIIFEVSEDEPEGGALSASAFGFSIHTQGDTRDGFSSNVRGAGGRYFGDATNRPRLLRQHYMRNQVLGHEATAQCRRHRPCGRTTSAVFEEMR